MRLYDIFKKYSRDGRHPFHMPGHMRNTDFDYLIGAYIDYTEIEGMDNLHAPEGILREAQEYAARVYSADHSFFLVNGATGGILSAICAACRGKSDIIMARNCHKSVYNAVSLMNLRASYIMPGTSEIGLFLDITADDVRKAIERSPSASAVVITSPSFDGVISDVAAIAEVCHSHGIPLIVDSAHGAHLGFLDETINSPVKCGADITIMSLHKTLPSLTQTAILHLKSSLITKESVASATAIFETTSPSYIFMASIDGCIHELGQRGIFEGWKKRLDMIREAADQRENVHLIYPRGVFAFDESKLILTADGFSGDELAALLREKFRIEPEMAAENYVLLMTGAGLTDECAVALCTAIGGIPVREKKSVKPFSSINILPPCAMKSSEAAVRKSEVMPFKDSVGRISDEAVMCYPPGIPLLVPGEVISDEIAAKISSLKDDGANILTSSGVFDGIISVIAE